jgi:hypothetical protein
MCDSCCRHATASNSISGLWSLMIAADRAQRHVSYSANENEKSMHAMMTDAVVLVTAMRRRSSLLASSLKSTACALA